MSNASFSVHRSLLMLGLGAAGTAVGAVLPAEQVFAKQFVCEGTRTKAPTMVYDPGLQVMVDPATRRPIYEDAKKLRLALPTVTSGCSDCPKADD